MSYIKTPNYIDKYDTVPGAGEELRSQYEYLTNKYYKDRICLKENFATNQTMKSEDSCNYLAMFIADRTHFNHTEFAVGLAPENNNTLGVKESSYTQELFGYSFFKFGQVSFDIQHPQHRVRNSTISFS